MVISILLLDRFSANTATMNNAIPLPSLVKLLAPEILVRKYEKSDLGCGSEGTRSTFPEKFLFAKVLEDPRNRRCPAPKLSGFF